MLDLSPDIAPPQPVRLADYRPPAFLIDTVDLAFDLGARDTRVKSRLAIRRNPAAAERAAALQLDGEELELVSLALDGEPLGANRYRLSPEGGLILADVPDAFTLDVETRIAPQSNTALSGLYVSGGNFCTQCEPEGFRRITYFIDRPDVMARYTTTITAEKQRYPVLLANGNPVERGDDRQQAALGEMGRSAPQALLSLRPRRGRSRRRRGPLHDALGQGGGARHLGAPRRRGQMRRMRWPR